MSLPGVVMVPSIFPPLVSGAGAPVVQLQNRRERHTRTVYTVRHHRRHVFKLVRGQCGGASWFEVWDNIGWILGEFSAVRDARAFLADLLRSRRRSR